MQIMDKEQKIALIRSIVSVWGGFSPSEVESDCGICVGNLGSLLAMVTYVSLDCIDVSVYSPNGFSSDSLQDYTMKYSELTDEVLDELVSLCRTYNEVMLEQEQE
jgi:hypothetical protein